VDSVIGAAMSNVTQYYWAPAAQNAVKTNWMQMRRDSYYLGYPAIFQYCQINFSDEVK
jgi:hypothetical protein